ncbi:MAG: energy transducer TonB [Bryobacteraceae bacterium]|jgi:TonB family protein
MDFRSFPSILVSLAALLLTGAAAQSPAPGDTYLDLLSQGNRLTAAEARALEDCLRIDPEDLAARGKLIAHYFVNLAREPWSRHVFWLIEHHPESPIAGFNFASISPSAGALSDEADYARAKGLWLEQTERHPKDRRVWANALRFFSQPGSDGATRERLLKRAEANTFTVGVEGSVLGGELSAAPPPPQAPTRIRVGGNVQSANLLEKVDPVYPPLAREARIQGTVRFTAIIGRDGHVQNLQLISGHPLLVPAAQEAVRQWVYRPTLLNGRPIEVITSVEVNFVLTE